MLSSEVTASTASPNALAASFSNWLDGARTAPAKKTKAAQRGAAANSVFSETSGLAFLDSARAVDLIRNGLLAGQVADLAPLLGLAKKEDLSHALNTNSTSLWRWARDNKPLPGATVEQILRTMQLQLFAAEVFGTVQAARQWLQKPHPSLQNLSPSDYADNEFGAQKVRGILAGLKYGGVA
jgi:putative toxin-antitoxin system antitoxin component (TIGR02293 family)